MCYLHLGYCLSELSQRIYFIGQYLQCRLSVPLRDLRCQQWMSDLFRRLHSQRNHLCQQCDMFRYQLVHGLPHRLRTQHQHLRPMHRLQLSPMLPVSSRYLPGLRSYLLPQHCQLQHMHSLRIAVSGLQIFDYL